LTLRIYPCPSNPEKQAEVNFLGDRNLAEKLPEGFTATLQV